MIETNGKHNGYGSYKNLPDTSSPFNSVNLIPSEDDQENKNTEEEPVIFTECDKVDMYGGAEMINDNRYSRKSYDLFGIKDQDAAAIPEEVVAIMSPFRVSESGYIQIMKRLELDMKMGLNPEQREKACVKMYPSYVCKIPTGEERGQFMVLDLGCMTYRISLVTLIGNKSPPDIDESTYAIPEIKMSGSGDALFDYIGESIKDFIKVKKLTDKDLSLAFVFSFPCHHKNLINATLVRWTKGFSASNVEGKDVKDLLVAAIRKFNLRVTCKATLNDTVGTLASGTFDFADCAIGVVVDKGANACYIEDITNVLVIDKSQIHPETKFVLINTELGAFGENGTLEDIRTKYDRAMDKKSVNPGKQIFEKLISGMYLGEIVRLLLLELIEKKIIFLGVLPDSIRKPYNFLTKYLSDCERDPMHLHYSTEYILQNDLKVKIINSLDCKIIRYVCETVARRAAFLTAAGISTILNRMNKSLVTVVCDGSLFKQHPSFTGNMYVAIEKFRNPGIEFVLKLSEDGVGKGAAAIAASYEVVLP